MIENTVGTTTPAGRNRIDDLDTVARFILRGLYTWAMAADWGVDYGHEMGKLHLVQGEPLRDNGRSYSSAEEVLTELGVSPETLGMSEDEADANWPPAPWADYAREIWLEAGALLRARGGPKPDPPKPARPPWANLKSKDGTLDLSIPDELIPFVGAETAELAANEVVTLVGLLHAYDEGPLRSNYASAGFVRSAFDIRMALWRERKRVADLLGRVP